MRPGSLNTLRLSHLSAASRPRCCVEAPEGNSAPRMCPGWHRSGAEPPLTACFALPAPRAFAVSILLRSHLSEPQAGPLCGTAVTLTLKEEGSVLRLVIAPCPGTGPAGASGGQTGEWASLVPLGETCPGPRHWLWAKMPACAFCSGSKTWLWGSAQDP